MHIVLYAAFSLLALLPSSVVGKTSAQLCRGTSTMADDGNWYCSEVTAITYKNISQPGEYNRTTRVNPQTGLCDHETVAYSGVSELTPLIGEVLEALLNELYIVANEAHSSRCTCEVQ
jgi:hypothetical protein